jgi:tetratricopeptide (TPR) repeat protein
MIGTVQTRLGDYAAAIENLSAGHELVASIGWVPGQTHFLANWADALLAIGLLDEASARHEQAYRRTIEIGDREGEAYSLDGLGLVAYFQENYDEAIRCFQAATQIYGEIGQQRLQFYTQNHLAYAGYHAGDLTLAAESLQAAQALLAAGAGDAASAIDTLGAAAAIDWATGDHVTALARCDEIAAYLDGQGPEGIEYPIQVCWICYEINLRASAQQPARQQQARTFLHHAAAHLDGRAATLSADLQHAYRHNIPLHRRLADELGTIGQQ